MIGLVRVRRRPIHTPRATSGSRAASAACGNAAERRISAHASTHDSGRFARGDRLPRCTRVVDETSAGGKVRCEPKRDERIVVQRRRVKGDDAATDDGADQRENVARPESRRRIAESHVTAVEQEQCRNVATTLSRIRHRRCTDFSRRESSYRSTRTKTTSRVRRGVRRRRKSDKARNRDEELYRAS